MMLIAHPPNCVLPWTVFWNNQTLFEAYTFLLSITKLILQITDNKTYLFFFRSIALWAIPYHPCSSSPPSVANNRATDLGSYNKCECACGGAYVCVQIFVANFCIMYMQLAHMCISTELLQMRLHLYVTSYLTKCDGSLPPPPALGLLCPQQVNLQHSLQLTNWMIDYLINWLIEAS